MTHDTLLPHAPANLRTEREGIIAVALTAARLGLIWRETSTADVGVDGQIEMVNDAGLATGQLVAVQVKSGESYMSDGGSHWRFFPDPKHRFYWERYPIPVLLILHSPARGESYWVDARYALKSPQLSSQLYIAVPKANVFERATAAQLSAVTGSTSLSFLPLDAVLDRLLSTVAGNASFPLSFFDLFANGLVNLGRSIFCSAHLGFEIAEQLLDAEGGEYGVEMGPSEHEFLFQFILFLAEQHLAEIDVDQCLIDWYEQQMQPTLLAPLTSRGRALVRLIDSHQDALVARGALNVPQGHAVLQEGSVQMYLSPSHMVRIGLIRRFREAMLSSTPGTSAGASAAEGT
jgi:hypothetical protein